MITEEVAKKHLDTLHEEGSTLAAAFAKKEESEPFEVGYQRWVRGMPADDRAGKARAGRPAKHDVQPGRWRSHPVCLVMGVNP